MTSKFPSGHHQTLSQIFPNFRFILVTSHDNQLPQYELPVAETRGGGEDVVLGEQQTPARGPVPACHRHPHQPGPAPITAQQQLSANHSSPGRLRAGRREQCGEGEQWAGPRLHVV